MKLKDICPCTKPSPKKLCCCITLEQAVIAIGVFNLAAMIVSVLHADLLGIALKVFTTVWFIMLMLSDT